MDSICPSSLQEITDLVRASASATPSCTSSPGEHEPLPAGAAAELGLRPDAAAMAAAGMAGPPYATASEGESRQACQTAACVPPGGQALLALAVGAPHTRHPPSLVRPPLRSHTLLQPPPLSVARLLDYLGTRPEQQDPLARVLDQELPPPFEPDSTPQRVLRALEVRSCWGLGGNELAGGGGLGSCCASVHHPLPHLD